MAFLDAIFPTRPVKSQTALGSVNCYNPGNQTRKSADFTLSVEAYDWSGAPLSSRNYMVQLNGVASNQAALFKAAKWPEGTPNDAGILLKIIKGEDVVAQLTQLLKQEIPERTGLILDESAIAPLIAAVERDAIASRVIREKYPPQVGMA